MSFVTVPCTQCGAKLKIRGTFARMQTEIRCVKCGAKIAIPKGPYGGQPSAPHTTPAHTPPPPLTAAPLHIPPIAAPVKTATANIPPAADTAVPAVSSHRLMVIKPNTGLVVAQMPAAHMPVAPAPLPPSAVPAAMPAVPKVIAIPAPVPEQAPRLTPAVTSAQPDTMFVELRTRVVKLEGDVQALLETLRQRPAEVETLNQKLMESLAAEINGTLDLWKQELQDNAKLELHRAESLVHALQTRIQRLQG